MIECMDTVHNASEGAIEVKCHQRDHIMQVQLASHISVFWLTVIFNKISWLRTAGYSGILVPHINISVWDFIYYIL